MMRTVESASFLLFLILFFCTSVNCQEIVRLSTIGGYKPICFHKDKIREAHEIIKPGEDSKFFKGLGFEIVKESFHSMGYTVELNILPWKRAMHMVKTGKTDVVFPAVKTEEREAKFSFSKELAYPSTNYVLYVKNRDLNFRKNILEALKGRVIGVVNGHSYGKKWEKYEKRDFFKICDVKTIERGFLLLDKNRIDAQICYEYPCEQYLEDAGLKKRFFKLPAFDSTSSYLISMKNEKGRHFLDAFDKGKEKIRQNKRLFKIYKKWKIEVKR